MGLLKPRPDLAFGHMEVRVDTDAPEVVDQVTYLYNFREGRSTSSFGTWWVVTSLVLANTDIY